MSEIQLFEQAFAVTFPTATANQLLGHMQALYGDGFNKKYGEIEQDRMISTVCQVLDGLSPIDLQRGIQRMKSEKWCPSLPEFRTWCILDDWWSPEQAWAKALNFQNDDSQPITTLAKRCLDEVGHILRSESQKAAHKAFIEIYLDYLNRAKKQGRAQIMHVVPKKPNAEVSENRKGIACPPELAAKIQNVGRRAS